MHFLVFIPGSNGSDAAVKMPAAGLADLAAGAEGLSVAPHESPNGSPGAIYTWNRDAKDVTHPLAYRPEHQEWVEAHGGAYWVGFWKDSPPTPQDLVREMYFASYPVTLGDGNQWKIPIACQLPRDFVFQDGKPRLEVKRAYASFFAESFNWYDRVHSADGSANEIEVPANWWDYALTALRLNYRITPEVMGRLRLIDTVNIFALVWATIDGHERTKMEIESQKKTDDTLPASS